MANSRIEAHFEKMREIAVNMIKSICPDPKFGCEVGIWKGLLSNKLLSNFPNMELYMVDAWLPQRRPWNQQKMLGIMKDAYENTVSFHRRRIILVGKSTQVVHLIPDGVLDFVYIDADHSKQSVLEDLDHWYPKVRSGGFVGGHDYLARYKKFPGCTEAINEWTKKHEYSFTHNLTNWGFQKR